jgi:two-component system, OmpR family, response regulator CpxR
MPAILMIDDDTGLCELVAEYLALDGYQFSAAHDGQHGLKLAESGDYDLVLLDVMLPGMDGLSVLKALRSGSYCPVLMLTARGDDVDRIVGLELGADDYLAKPFNPRELVARIKAILRRVELTRTPPPDSNSILQQNGLLLNPHNRQLSCNAQLINLTATEFQLLELLMRRAGEVVSKDELSRQVLGKRLQMYDRSLDMHISNIRKKIAPFSDGEKIQTLRGSGYLFLTGDV